MTGALLISMPIEIEVHTVPHFKARVNCKVEWWGQEHAGTFMQSNGIMKLGRLVHKMGFVKTAILCTVLKSLLRERPAELVVLKKDT